MLNQRKNVTASAAQTVPQPSTAAPPVNDSSDAGSAQTSTAVAQPTVTYVQNRSVIECLCGSRHPDLQLHAYNYQPYYYPYLRRCPYPAVSLHLDLAVVGAVLAAVAAAAGTAAAAVTAAGITN